MQIDLKSHRNYIDIKNLLKILEFIEKYPCSKNQLRSYFSDTTSITKYLDDTISLLYLVGVVRLRENEKISMSRKLIDEKEIITEIMKYLSKKKIIIINFNTEAQCYHLFISYPYYSVRNFLIDSEIITRINYNSYLLKDNYFEIVDKINRNKKSIEQLKKDLLKKEEAGLAAEKFVLEFETQRFLGKKIEHTSLTDVGAGFDIKSYLGKESEGFDKFIEVKSYSEFNKFYWTKNEMEVASLLGDNYFLYLVKNTLDSDPIEIKNPYKKIYLNEEINKQEELISVDINENFFSSILE